MMYRDINMLEGPEPERPSRDLATQPANATVGPHLDNAASADHLHDYTPAGERHTIRPPEGFDRKWPHLSMYETHYKQLLEEREPQQLQERVSPPSYLTVPGPDGSVAYRTHTANTASSDLRPPLPTDLKHWADISMYDYMQYMPDILTWNPPPFITNERHWTTIQETGDGAAAFETPPARFVGSLPARFVELPPARSVDSRHTVHTSGHIPVSPLMNLPTPARSVESGPSRSVKRPARSAKSKSTRSAKSRPARSVKPPAKRRYESPPAHMPFRPIPLVYKPLPLSSPPPLTPFLPPSAHTPMPLPAYAPLPPPIHSYFHSPFFPPVAHSTHMPVYPPAYMPPNPTVPEHKDVRPLLPGGGVFQGYH